MASDHFDVPQAQGSVHSIETDASMSTSISDHPYYPIVFVF